MAKPYKIPDFRKMYPEASEEVIAVLRTSERKMQYQEYDLKRARNIVDPKTGEKMTIPSREDSYERLQEMAVQFPEENRSVEERMKYMKKIGGGGWNMETIRKRSRIFTICAVLVAMFCLAVRISCFWTNHLGRWM